MHGPPLVGWLLVVLCTATGAYGLVSTRAGAAGERRAAGGDALMGLGMAAMAVPAAVLHTRPWGYALYAVVFGAAGLHTLIRARREPEAHHLHHAVGAFAMVYMALAMAGTPAATAARASAGAAHAGHAAAAHEPAGTPLLTGLLLVYFAVYVVRGAAQMVPVPAGAPAEAGGPGRAPGGRELTHACRLSMGIGMLAMLLTM
ncbi:DUF5134 domain-containing protein [Streptomyces sp. NPDC053079]|uniref:DUF5134 domain-containing protein n=1 Tax=Streptomyces sp. NPDC053079 TaxID=3365697 RepID=UPI0037CFEFD9